jgi:hypothetical protein
MEVMRMSGTEENPSPAVTELTASKEKPTPVVNRGYVIFPIGEFKIHPATFWSSDTNQVESGYAVTWDLDGVVQMLTNNIAGALNFAGGAQQTLDVARQIIAQAEQAASTEGLLDVGGDFPEAEVLN